MPLPVIVGWRVGPIPSAADREDEGRVEDRAVHVDLLAPERRAVGEELEGGADLPGGGGGHVDLAPGSLVVRAADHGENLAGLGIHADQRRVMKVVVLAGAGDLRRDGHFGLGLQGQVQAGYDPEPTTAAGADVVLVA